MKQQGRLMPNLDASRNPHQKHRLSNPKECRVVTVGGEPPSYTRNYSREAFTAYKWRVFGSTAFEKQGPASKLHIRLSLMPVASLRQLVQPKRLWKPCSCGAWLPRPPDLITGDTTSTKSFFKRDFAPSFETIHEALCEANP